METRTEDWAMHSETHRVFFIEPGRWPLLSRRTFPFSIKPKEKGEQWIFEDYGCNHALPYIFLFVLALGTVLVVEFVPGSNWGDPGYPIQSKNILLICSLLLGLYSFYASLFTTDLLCAPSTAELKSRHLFMGFIPVKQMVYECSLLTIDIRPVCIAFTRTGMFSTKCVGVFLSGGTSVPMKLIACFRDENDAREFASETGMQLGLEVVESAVEVNGRLSR